MRFLKTALSLTLAIPFMLLLLGVRPAAADIIYVGSFQVGQGPFYTTAPITYSGITAAQLLFGPGTYEISTISDLVASINNESWYSTYGVSGGQALIDTFTNSTRYNAFGDSSAYVQDNAVGAAYTNYVFKVTPAAVPEPASLVLLSLGLIVLFYVRKRSVAG
jgi:hypothetical protein